MGLPDNFNPFVDRLSTEEDALVERLFIGKMNAPQPTRNSLKTKIMGKHWEEVNRHTRNPTPASINEVVDEVRQMLVTMDRRYEQGWNEALNCLLTRIKEPSQ